jgi:hypothetical protein
MKRSVTFAIVVVVIVVLVAYTASYFSLLHRAHLTYARPLHSRTYVWVSSDPAWNQVGYYYFLPVHTVTNLVVGGHLRFVTDPNELRALVRD